jgi:GTP-binding protein Era
MTEAEGKEFRSGFAALIGRTNVGKSTLLNALVGRKISIVTAKPQTTRYTVRGVVHRPEGQIVFVDTPGFFKTHPSRLVDSLHERAREALDGIDAVVHVVDPCRMIGTEDHVAMQTIARTRAPKVLCLNKADLKRRPFAEAWRVRSAGYAATVEVSALKKRNLDALIHAVLRLLPIGPPLYPESQITDAHEHFLITEAIREKVYLRTGAEVPYRTDIELDSVEERNDKTGRPMTCIKAAVLTPSDHYQRMLIGAGGRKIKEIGMAARVDLERMLGRKVFLDLAVLVDKKLLH